MGEITISRTVNRKNAEPVHLFEISKETNLSYSKNKKLQIKCIKSPLQGEINITKTTYRKHVQLMPPLEISKD